MSVQGEIRATQMVLPIEQLVTSFNLDLERAEFVTQYILAAHNGAEAMREVKKISHPGKEYSDKYLRKRACMLLKEDEVNRAIEMRTQHAALGAGANEAEFFRGVRTMLRIALGEAPIRRSVVRSVEAAVEGKEDETESVDEVRTYEIYEPNLAAAGKSLDLLARAQGLLSDKLQVELPVVKRYFDSTPETAGVDDAD